MRMLVLFTAIFCAIGCPIQDNSHVVQDAATDLDHDSGSGRIEPVVPIIESQVKARVTEAVVSTTNKLVGVRSWKQLPSRSRRGRVTDYERDVIMSSAVDFHVPSGILYGIWSVESGRLHREWHPRWVLARLLPQYGSACARRYGIIRCRTNWEALERICAQQRGGQPICDPKRVRTSRALAMGPMQHLPIKWSPAREEWAIYVVDYDQDGTFDPHNFADAVGSSAGHLRKDYELARNELKLNEANAWRHAARMYLGKATARHYERKVYQYLRNWCSLPGYCTN
jgi:hypothetical protein